MKIKFLGTGAAEGFPAVFCSCENCINARKLDESEWRTRAQVVIDGELSVDFPPEAYYHALKFGVDLSALKYLLVTHSHMDHFYAHDFILRGYKYAVLKEDVLRIFGNSEVEKVFYECCRREIKETVKPHLSFTQVGAYSAFALGEYKVAAIPAQHGNTEEALLYYIERAGKGYLHMHDSGRVSGEALNYLVKIGAKVNAVCFDCTFLYNSYGAVSRHMGLEDNLVMKEELTKRGLIDSGSKLILSHFSHNSNPLRSRLKEVERETGMIAAYDGLEIEI